MPAKLFNPAVSSFGYHQIVPAITILDGIAGWIDVDLSAAVGIGRKLVYMLVWTDVGGYVGVRETGSGLSAFVSMGIIGDHAGFFVNTDAAGHFEAYRQGVGWPNYYQVLGYFL